METIFRKRGFSIAVGAGKRGLEQTFTRHYGENAPDLSWELRSNEVQALLRRTRALLEADTPAYRALDLVLERWDRSEGDFTDLHGILRTGIVAAQALLEPEFAVATTEQVAAAVLTGWQTTAESRSGEGADERRGADQVRAIEDAATLLGPDHPVAQSLQRAETRAAAAPDAEQARAIRAQALDAAVATLQA